MSAQPQFPRIPLDKLQLSSLNARKTHSGGGVADLAASIAAHGLLQNLTVMPAAGNDDGAAQFEVVAGGRRLAAMQLLRSQGRLPDELDTVPCLVVTDADIAHEASTAENTLREAMHPADQFDAFKAMVDAGKPIPDIAAHFGVAEVVVKQRLKLANVSPKLVQLYRDDGIQLDQLQALALTDDHEAQEQAWFGAKESWHRTAGHLREALTKREVRSDNVVARFVGVDAYEAAGGAVRRDLFSSTAYLADKKLLDTLALDKLEAIAQAERDAGWSWAQAFLTLDYSQLSEYPRHPAESKHAPPSREDEARIKQIEKRIEEIDALWDENRDEWQSSALNDDVAAASALDEEREHLHTELQELKAGRREWPAHARAEAGVLVYLGYNGPEIQRGRLKPGQHVAAGGAIAGKAKASSAEAAAADKPKKAELSDSMVRRLTAHRTIALQEELARRPDVALQLLVTHLLGQLVASSTSTGLIKLTGQNVLAQQELAIRSGWTDLEQAPAWAAMQGRLKALKTAGVGKSGGQAGLAAWVAKQTRDQLLELLALCVALTLDAVHGAGGRLDQANALADLLGVDMATWWKPNAENFLALVPKALVFEAVTEAKGKAVAQPLADLGKQALIAEAGKHLSGSGWLPKPLRGAGYGTSKAQPPAAAKSKAAAKGKSSKPAAKKVVKKAAKKPAAKKATKAK